MIKSAAFVLSLAGAFVASTAAIVLGMFWLDKHVGEGAGPLVLWCSVAVFCLISAIYARYQILQRKEAGRG